MTVVVGMLIGYAGLFVLGFQCVLWLKNGYWTGLPLGMLSPFGAPDWGWIGLESVLAWVLSLPLAGSLIVSGFVLAFCGAIADEERAARRENLRRKR